MPQNIKQDQINIMKTTCMNKIKNSSSMLKNFNSPRNSLLSLFVILATLVLISTPDFADAEVTKKLSEKSSASHYWEIKYPSTKILSISEQISSQDPPHVYNIVLKACSNEMIRMPQVTIKSDIEAKTVKLADKISPKSCQTTASFIKSTSKNAIVVSLENNIQLTKTIADLENNITKLQEKLSSTQLKLNQTIKEKPVNYEKKINELNSEIIKIRNQITGSKSTLNKILNQVYQ